MVVVPNSLMASQTTINNMKKIGIVLIAIILAVVIFKDFLIQCAISNVGSTVLGAPVEVGSFGWNFFTQKIHIRDLRVFNPPGFPHQPLIDIPAIDVDYDLPSLMKGNLYFPYINVDLKEMVIVKNAQGQLNVDALKVSQKTTGQSSSQAPQAVRPLSIDVMKLSLGRTVYMDYSGTNRPLVKVFNVGFKNKTFKNIKSVQQLSVVILTQGVGSAAIKTAAIYGVATILGASLMPVGMVAILIGKDSAQEEYATDFDHVYDIVLGLLKEAHEFVSEARAGGLIKGNIDGGDLTVQIQQRGDKVHVSASCRKMMIPRHEIASDFIYQLSNRLK